MRPAGAEKLKRVDDQSVVDRVEDELRDAIERGMYKPGARLVERRLADELHVSHIPIREALTRLAREGLVEQWPRRGSRVAALSQRELDDICGLRIVLERYVVERARQRWSADAERELDRIVSLMATAAARGDRQRLHELDVRFHSSLWELTDHASLRDVASRMRARVNGFLRAAALSLDPQQLQEHAAAHANLLNAISNDRLVTAQDAMAHHIEQAKTRIVKALPQDSEPGSSL